MASEPASLISSPSSASSLAMRAPLDFACGPRPAVQLQQRQLRLNAQSANSKPRPRPIRTPRAHRRTPTAPRAAHAAAKYSNAKRAQMVTAASWRGKENTAARRLMSEFVA
jgi:hypothetical protein